MRALLRPFLAGAAAAACVAGAVPATAQAPDLGAEVTVGSEAERYLRMLQVGGEAPLYPWSARAFSPGEVSRLMPADRDHPWAARVAGASADSARLRLVRPRVQLVFNSAFPQGANDGAVWAGRGLTASASAGVQLRAGPLSVRLEPLVYWTQNRDFRLVPNGRADSLAFRDPRSPIYIDLPQRLDDGAFARLDPGQSTIRLDVRGFAAGFSTANLQWGPAIDQPLVLGNNAAGFPHAFAGTSSPWKVGIGRVHGRIVWGSLGQSAYSPMPAGEHASRRFVSGLSAIFLPYGLDGLEVGVARFHHQAWPLSGFDLSLLPRPLEAFWRNSLRHPDEALVNQVTSVYGRWVLPAGGVEVYGEFAREDHSYDYLDFVLEPDRSSGYMLGGRKAWAAGRARRSFRAEWVNTQPGHLEQASNQSTNLYRNIGNRQGHTVGGQLLGSLSAYGGSGAVLALDTYTPRGRWSVDYTRTRLSSPRTVGGEAYGVNAIQSLGGEVVVFRGGSDLVGRLRASRESNRYPGESAFNLTAELGARIGF